MQNAVNNSNNFTVENLVAKYRNYVAENCPKEAFCDEYQDKSGIWHTNEGYMPIYLDSDAIEQLIVAVYKHVAGDDADKQVLKALSKCVENYYNEALTEEEFSFLCENYEDTMNFSFSYLKEHNGRLMYSVPTQMIDIIGENTMALKKGDVVFVADARNGDIASMFPACSIKGYTSNRNTGTEEEVWALVQIRLFAQGMKSDILKSTEGCTSETYLKDVDLVIMGTSVYSSFDDVATIYQRIKPGAQMILFLDEKDAAMDSRDTCGIRKVAVDDCSIKSIVSFEFEDVLAIMRTKIALIIEKTLHKTVHIENGITGDCSDVPATVLDPELLWPSFYSTKRPDSGIPLSELVAFVDLTDREVIKDDDGEWVLPEDVKQMPVAVPAKMAKEYKDANLLTKDLDLAGSKLFDEQWKFWIRFLKEPCVLLYGNKEKTVVGYIRELPKTGIATLDTIVCLVPKDGIDVRYVAALLLTPEVKGQLESICQGSINDTTFPLIMNKVIVPNHSDKERLEFMSEANYEALNASQKELVKEHQNYTKAVRMRKHALSQSFSAMKAMFSVLNTCRKSQDGVLSDKDKISPFDDKTVRDAFEFLSDRFDTMAYRLDHIADVEYNFSKPEWIDPEGFIEKYIEKNKLGWISFIPKCSWEKGHNLAKEDIKEPTTGNVIIKKGEPLQKLFFSRDALERVISNIVSNAQSHGFTDEKRNDYILRFSWHLEGTALIMEIENNGTPIPSDRSTSSLLEYGVSTALNKDGHNGIGCNEIDVIMRKYNGSVKIVSTPDEEFKVKYILRFEHTNSFETQNI